MTAGRCPVTLREGACTPELLLFFPRCGHLKESAPVWGLSLAGMSLVPAAPVKPRCSRVHVQEAEGPGLRLKTLRMRCCQVHKKVDAGGDRGGAGSRVGEAVSGERPHEKAVPCAQEAGGASPPTSLSDPSRGLLEAQAQCRHRPVRHPEANFRNKAVSPQGPGACSGLAKWPGSLDGPVRSEPPARFLPQNCPCSAVRFSQGHPASGRGPCGGPW